MEFYEMEQAFDKAQQTMNLADRFASKMARMLIGRLRHVYGYNVLKRLKMELRDYNAHTDRWKD